jgi:flagellar biosynthesis protein FlhA
MTGSVSRGNSVASVFIIGVLLLMLVPLPASVLDVLLALSLCFALLTFMVALFVERPLDFSAFPSLLLLVTLLRLALNVATTRRILLFGNEGVDAAGGMIRAFGEFAVGGNYVVGAVVFLILVLVNFIVITKGAERISEVAARFTLDSMPGKQMAIDADLGAGLINESGAKQRRKDLEQEADFYGTMDGASKFVRGDAVAGLVITGINILGGIIIGVMQHDMTAAASAQTYTILSIGDGLVSQIPALLVSTGAALLTTRSSSGGDFGGVLGEQLFSRARPMTVVSGVLAGLALMPGMPHLSLLALAGGLVLLARKPLVPRTETARIEAAELPSDKTGPEQQRAEIESLLPLDLLSIQVGLDLLPLVDAEKNGELLVRIASLRKQVAMDLGIILPPVHVQDDLRLAPGSYDVQISGVSIGKGSVRMGRLMAIDAEGVLPDSLGRERCQEPAFGLPALWISPSERGRAESLGATVVDPSAVIATHLTQLIRQHAHELLGRREAQALLDLASRDHEKLVEDLIPSVLSAGEVLKVLRGLLKEGVSIRDMRTILEAVADHAPQTKDPNELTELVRQRLFRQLTKQHLSGRDELSGLILDPGVENLFRPQRGPVDPGLLSVATQRLEQMARAAAEGQDDPILVVAPDIRRVVAEVAHRHVPGLAVLSYRELDPRIPFITKSIVRLEGTPS